MNHKKVRRYQDNQGHITDAGETLNRLLAGFILITVLFFFLGVVALASTGAMN